MGRSLGVVIVGWGLGFLIAIAWGATRASNSRLASWAIAGVVITAILLVSTAISGWIRRRDAAAPSSGASGEADDRAVAPTAMHAARDVAATERRTAARIAELEARLAREQEELDAAAASLAATELAETGHVRGGSVATEADHAAAELEPVLRQEVVDVVAALVAGADPGQTAVLAGELEALLDKAQ